MDEIFQRFAVENNQKWRDEIKTMPWITFPENWKVQIIPPFGDAVIRFRVELPSGEHRSIYLDARNSIGIRMDDDGNLIPYWEVYPYRGDVGRCDKEDIVELLRMIGDESTDWQEEEDQ